MEFSSVSSTSCFTMSPCCIASKTGNVEIPHMSGKGGKGYKFLFQIHTGPFSNKFYLLLTHSEYKTNFRFWCSVLGNINQNLGFFLPLCSTLDFVKNLGTFTPKLIYCTYNLRSAGNLLVIHTSCLILVLFSVV